MPNSDITKSFFSPEVAKKIGENIERRRKNPLLFTESQWLTAAYLKRLHEAPDSKPLGNGRYKG